MHWGADLGALEDSDLVALAEAQVPGIPPSSIDAPSVLSLLPVASEGFSGTPGIAGSRLGVPTDPFFRLAATDRVDTHRVRFSLVDDIAGLAVDLDLGLSPDGVLALRASVTNSGDAPWLLARLGLAVPVPPRAREVLDVGGRWAFERRPQRRALDHGTWSRQTRHGRNGHDSPLLFAAGTEGFGFRHGEVWALHLAWSGDHDLFAESHPTGLALLGGGELLAPGEIELAAGATYSTPWLLGAWSAEGLDGVSVRFHAWSRAARSRELGERPLMLNTWEAVYFDHDLDRLTELATIAAGVGVERFVLDDGWMTGRTDDTKALGDWTVDPVRWPRGLHPLVDHVRSLGMQFGLWIEPEMVSLDSDLARQHPDWVLGAHEGQDRARRRPLAWRNQFALDLDNPSAYANILAQLCALLDEYDISYLKWDQNRDLLAGSVHRQTAATWRLLEQLRELYPHVEIESCSSGGGRVDLGVLRLTDRVWASDTNDPLERQAIQRWTSVVIPPEVIGSHLGAATAHTTGRTSDLGFRLATAFFWSAGIEWDLTLATAAELAQVRTWADRYRELRGILHGGSVVRADSFDPALQVHGVVSMDASAAVFAAVCLAAPRTAVSAGLVLPGLDPDAQYRVEPLDLGAPVHYFSNRPTPWVEAGGVTLSGRMLAEVGLSWPALQAQQALVLLVRRV